MCSSITFLQCRMKGTTYEAPLTVSFCCQINDTNPEDITDVVGEIPIMLKVGSELVIFS